MAKLNRFSLLFLVSLAIQVIALISLATAASLLTKEVIAGTGLPWGNVLTWLLFTLFPVNFLLIRRQSNVHPLPRKVYYTFVYAGMVFGFLWLFVSYFLAGNWSATFHGEDTRSAIWQYYTYATPLLPFIGYFLMRLLMVFLRMLDESIQNLPFNISDEGFQPIPTICCLSKGNLKNQVS